MCLSMIVMMKTSILWQFLLSSLLWFTFILPRPWQNLTPVQITLRDACLFLLSQYLLLLLILLWVLFKEEQRTSSPEQEERELQKDQESLKIEF